jgi:hypothetical protein
MCIGEKGAKRRGMREGGAGRTKAGRRGGVDDASNVGTCATSLSSGDEDISVRNDQGDARTLYMGHLSVDTDTAQSLA